LGSFPTKRTAREVGGKPLIPRVDPTLPVRHVAETNSLVSWPFRGPYQRKVTRDRVAAEVPVLWDVVDSAGRVVFDGCSAPAEEFYAAVPA
jgi:hypothetical protein